jgi:hypothetical protein
VPGKRPINADVPGSSSPETRPEAAKGGSPGETPSSQGPRRGPREKAASALGRLKSALGRLTSKLPRKPVPLGLKLVGAAICLVVVFILAAIVGGSHDEPGVRTPAPVTGDTEAVDGASAELGYPAFATSNTTRVGGADPAFNAAGVALAVYPSVEPAQRPAAVALVPPDQWQASIAASVLMAAPLGLPDGVPASVLPGVPTGAPLLISEADGVPEPTAQALEALDPQGSRQSRGVQAYAIGNVAIPGGLEAKRVAGKGPAATAAAIAALRDRLFGGPPAHIVIAPLANASFAMPAAAWAARSGDPILFTGRDSLPKPTRAALKRHPDLPVYVLGPDAAISAKAVEEISEEGRQVRRIEGEGAVENAIALARYGSGGFGWNVNDPGHGFVIARSDSPLDAAAAAPLSASGTWGPLLLTDNADTLPPALRGYLLDVKPGYSSDPTRAFYNHVWVIGDQEAIDVRQQAEIDELAELARIGGES